MTTNNASAKEPINLCRNGGFEILNPAGNNFPVNWSGGSFTVIDKDAHSGAIAIRLIGSEGRIVVLNSDPMPARKGKMSFWYKAIRSNLDGVNLQMFVIGTSGGIEITRLGFAVPAENIGDGKWHNGTLNFDFTANSAIDGVIFAPRVNERNTAADGIPLDGEWLVDDFECAVERIGIRPEIAALYKPNPVMTIGKPSELVIHVSNNGDTPTGASQLALILPEGITVKDGSKKIDVEPIEPNGSQRFVTQLLAEYEGTLNIVVDWAGEGFKLSRTRDILCVKSSETRKLCTDVNGVWRLMPEPVSMQLENPNPVKKLKTKKSKDLPDSFIGVTAHLPRTRDLETIFEPQHLIDGNPHTSWSSWAHATPIPGATEWAQVDFESNREISEIKLTPYHRAEGFPGNIEIKLRTGRSLFSKGKWQTVKKINNLKIAEQDGLNAKQPYSIKLTSPIKANAIRIEATRFKMAISFFCDPCVTYYFRLSQIQALTTDGENVASADAGAKAKVSSTFRSWYNDKEIIAETYKELYNLGVKWNRVGQWGDWTGWSAVEQEKGKYYIDPTMDKAITESVNNGVNILYTLCYGNRLYEETPWLTDPGPVWRQGHPFTGDGGPTTPEAIRGFVNYAKFVAKHFKGRIKYYEIWNEENSWAWYGSPPSPKAYGTLLRETAKALKEIDPEIKVSTGGTAALAPTFISESIREGNAGEYLDAIAFHPYGSPWPEIGLGSLDIVDGVQRGKTSAELGFSTTKEMLAFYKKTFAEFNPNFEFWSNEWNAMPKREDTTIGSGSETREAKIVTRWYLMATLTKVRAVWWTLTNQNSIMDWGLLRMADNSKKPAFFATQNMATLLSGAEPDPTIKTTVIGEAPELFCEPMRSHTGEIMVAIWSAIAPDDDEYEGKRVSLKINAANPKKVDAVDTLHGLTQKLVFTQQDDSIIIDNLLVTDYPVIVRIKNP